MSAIGNLVVNFLGNAKPLQGTLASVRSMVGGFAGTIAGLLGAGVSIEAAREDIAAQKKLQAVLTATGYAAGLTAGNIRDLATDLQGVTNFADETTVAAAAVLDTFKSIKGDQFKDTLKVAQDLATVFDMDLQSATIKLGKALQDPIQGIGSLHKVGISFNEQQKATIKSLVESGDAMGAQKYILEQLKGSFGGAAEAMASPFKILQNILNDIGEEIGKSLLVPMKYLAQTVIPFLKQWGSELAKVALAVLALVGVLKVVSAAQKAVAIGQALILSLGGPAGWASLAAGAAIFAGGLALVNAEFGKMQGQLDASQAKFAALAQAGGQFTDKLAGRELGGKTEAANKEDSKTRERLTGEFIPKYLGTQLKEAYDAFGGIANTPVKIIEGIKEKFTGAGAATQKLTDEIRLLSGATQSQLDIEKLWKADSGLTAQQAKDLEALIKKRDELGKQKDLMKDLTAQAKSLFEETRTPMEKQAEQIAKINDLYAKGLISQNTRDRAITQANEKATGTSHMNDATAAVEFGSSAAYSAIFAAQRTGAGGTAQDKLLAVAQQQLGLDETQIEIQERVAKAVEKFGVVEFAAGTV